MLNLGKGALGNAVVAVAQSDQKDKREEAQNAAQNERCILARSRPFLQRPHDSDVSLWTGPIWNAHSGV